MHFSRFSKIHSVAAVRSHREYLVRCVCVCVCSRASCSCIHIAVGNFHVNIITYTIYVYNSTYICTKIGKSYIGFVVLKIQRKNRQSSAEPVSTRTYSCRRSFFQHQFELYFNKPIYVYIYTYIKLHFLWKAQWKPFMKQFYLYITVIYEYIYIYENRFLSDFVRKY